MTSGPSLISWVEAVVSASPHRPAIFFDDSTWTYGDLWERSARIAHGLIRLPGFESGCRIGLVGLNTAEYLAAYLGVMRAGAVVVPLNEREQTGDLAVQLQFVEAACCLVSETEDHRRGLADAGHDVYRIADVDGAHTRPLPAASPSADAMVLLTSGSTGAPKGVRHTQSTLLHAALQLALAMPFAREDISIAFLPFFASIPEQVLPVLVSGATLDVLRRFDVEAVSAACARATTLDAVPTIVSRLLDHGDTQALNHLRWICFASEPMPPSVLQRLWDAAPDAETHQFYGMTEMLTITHAGPATMEADQSTVGTPFPTSAVAIIDSDFAPVPEGEEGEVTCRSPALMAGYLNDADATDAALTPDGAIRTGDVGRLDELGRLHLTGRLKDLIISGGLNISPAEIEAVACGHPRVASAAVVGIPDDRWGETPALVVVPAKGNSLTPREVLEYCRDQLVGYKRPSAAAVVATLPITGIGKSAKADLRDAILRGELKLERAS